MSGMIIIEQITDTAELPTIASGDFAISAIADNVVMKNDAQSLLYIEAWRRATTQTTDATPTVILSSAVIAEGQVMKVKAKIQSRLSTLGAGLGAELWVEARRVAAGNVTLVGSVQGTTIEDGTTPSVTLVANTSTQKVDIQITGVAAQTWDWQANICDEAY